MTGPEAFRDIDLHVTKGIATISFARPRYLNAASENLLREMLTTLYALEHRDDVGVVVVRGTGPAFSSGFDLAEIPAEPDGSRGIHAHFRVKALYYHTVIHMLARIGKPTLAAVTGPAAGGGLGMVLACDLAVCTEGATFLPAWMAIGIANDAGTSFYLSRIVGYRRAMEWLLTNRTLGAAEALEWGVVNRVYPEAEFEARVTEVAAQLAAAPAHLQALVKTRIQEGSSQALEDCTEHEIQNVMASVVHPHFRERLGQFRDKTMRSSAVVVDLDRHEAGTSTS
jgi:2-(1,2-epoxy-1,2-dihydrophenyl)acetyl-CoA isomerase